MTIIIEENPELGCTDISELKVMQSNAGYYLGTGYNDEDSVRHPFPYSRDSEYFKTHEEAVEEFLIEMDYLYGPNIPEEIKEIMRKSQAKGNPFLKEDNPLRAMTHARVTYHKWLRNFEVENDAVLQEINNVKN